MNKLQRESETDEVDFLTRMLFDEIQSKAGRIFKERQQHQTKLHDLNFERRVLRRQIEQLSIPIEKYNHATQFMYSEDDVRSDILRYIEDAAEYVNREYDKGKEEGRNMSALFRSLFKLIGDEAYIKATEKL